MSYNSMSERVKGALMFNSQKIVEISKVSKAEKWPFPKTFNALAEAGVEFYDVDLRKGSITYHGNGFQMTENDVPDLKNPPPCGEYNLEGLKEAIHIHQVKRTPYSEVMKEVVKAGISHYRVDILARTCTYFGKNSGETYAENIPAW